MLKVSELKPEIGFGAEEWASEPARCGRILVVDRDAPALDATCSCLRIWEPVSVEGAHEAGQALRAIALGIDLLIVDVGLENGSAVTIVEAAFAQRISPLVIATGHAPAAEVVFQLAKAGTHAYIEKPFELAQLEACMSPFDVDMAARRLLRPFVGHLGMKDIQSHVREALVREALERSG